MMNPILSQARTIMLTMLVWLFIGSLIASLLVFTQGIAWVKALVFALPTSLVFGFISASAFYVCRALPMQKRRFLLVCGIFGGTSIVSASAWLALCYLWNNFCLLLAETENWVGITITHQLALFILISGSLLYLLSILAYDVLIAFESIRHSERRQAASLIMLRDAELQVLRTQINPHFLFNSLNSISALTAIDPVRARNMTIELANFFRETLALSEKQAITLEQEIALCNHFLSIEKIRFGKKLQVTMEMESQSLPCLIPPMLLQPLIENAIKHGIRDLADGGAITMQSVLRDQWLYIIIDNPIDLGVPAQIGTGTGLRNLQNRLVNLYAGKARVNWVKSVDTFHVEIVLPISI